MSDLREGYEYIYCPIHKKRKLGQIKKGAKIDGEVLVFCNMCKHVVEVRTKDNDYILNDKDLNLIHSIIADYKCNLAKKQNELQNNISSSKHDQQELSNLRYLINEAEGLINKISEV